MTGPANPQNLLFDTVSHLRPSPAGADDQHDSTDCRENLGGALVANEEHAPVQNCKIMIVDDEPINIKAIRKHLALGGYEHFCAVTESTDAMSQIIKHSPDVVLLDILMPVISGLELLRTIREEASLAGLPVIVVSAMDDRDTMLQALELGATDFLSKPIDPIELLPRVRNALLVKAHHDHLKNHAEELQRQVYQRTSELAASRLEMIHCLGRAAEYRDNETGRHVVRVGRYVGVIARRLHLEPELVELLEHAAPLHDMGKLGIPDAILLKPGKLDPEEFEAMQSHCRLGKRTFEPMTNDEFQSFRSHTLLGERILYASSSPILEMAARIALTHHERWDGSGYPLGLAGEDIPLEGRITAVADVFDALSSRRPYKPAFPLDKCMQILEESRGKHFDPQVLDGFFAGREEIVDIRIRFADVD